MVVAEREHLAVELEAAGRYILHLTDSNTHEAILDPEQHETLPSRDLRPMTAPLWAQPLRSSQRQVCSSASRRLLLLSITISRARQCCVLVTAFLIRFGRRSRINRR